MSLRAGVSTPIPDVVSTRELFQMLWAVTTDDHVADFGVIECAPPLDTDGRTAAAGMRVSTHSVVTTENHHD